MLRTSDGGGRMTKTPEIGFTIIEHEADIGLEIYGRNLSELFMHGGNALFSLITDPHTVEPRLTKTIMVDIEEGTLVVFLNELLYFWDTEKFLPCSFSVSEKTEKFEVILTGEIFDPCKHPVRKEIKAVTYHKFAILQAGDLLKATVFLDI